MTICPECGTQNRSTASYCAKCGASLAGVPGTETVPQPVVQATGEHTPPPRATRPGRTNMAVSENGPPTQPLPPLPLEPLAGGAFVGDESTGEFRIDQILNDDDSGIHVYSATAVTPVRPCPHCGNVKNEIDENFCSQCGGDLSQSSPTYRSYIIKESDDPSQLASEMELMHEGLDDPALYLPEASFEGRVAGTVRHYVAIPAPPATTLADRQPPEELPTVLSWGAMLARGLAVLHRQQIAIDGVKPGAICVSEEHAGWCDLSACHLQAAPRALVSDVRQLAGLLFYLATGQKQYATVPGWPETVQSLFERALTTADQVPSAEEMAGAMAEALEALRRPGSIDFRLGRRTDVGMQRQLNEDSMLTVELVWNNRSQSKPVSLSVIADGMGGHAAGEVASGLAIQAMAREASRGLLVPTTGAGGEIPAYESWLKEAVQAANTAVHERVRASGNDMGTTLVAALVVGDVAHLAHVGDSRIYRVSAQAIEQITVDHSLVERLVATGQITREEAKYHPQRNVIYRTIGDKAKVEVDMDQVELRPGDRLLLCSDGLSGMIDDEEIQRLILLHTSPQAACDALVQAANAAGGDDNVTAIIVEVVAL